MICIPRPPPPKGFSGSTRFWCASSSVCCARRTARVIWSRTSAAVCVHAWRPMNTAVARSRSSPGHCPNRETCSVGPRLRRQLFGNAALGLLYSGNFGRAHCYEEFLELARLLGDESIRFCFGVRGNRANELRAAVRNADRNVSFAGFAPESELAKRLAAADIHLVSLRPDWTGVVVPSKFFGSLAAGRPVIFAGSRDAAIARWIEAYGVGWVLDRSSLEKVARDLRHLAQLPGRINSAPNGTAMMSTTRTSPGAGSWTAGTGNSGRCSEQTGRWR